MTRRIRTTLLAATAASALLLTACGGSDSSDDEIEGVNEGDNQQQEQSQEATDDTQEGVDRPEIELPDDLHLVFEDWESSDPDEQAVLDDGRERLRSVFAAVAYDRDPEAEHVLFYNAEGEALENAQYWIEGFTDYNLTIEGTIRYVNPEVTVQEEGGAILTYCADESDARAVDIETGEPEEQSEETDLFYSTNLEENESGVWVTTNVHTNREDCA